jgi:hypothetical protein
MFFECRPSQTNLQNTKNHCDLTSGHISSRLVWHPLDGTGLLILSHAKIPVFRPFCFAELLC